jgi:hypothetical protein
MRRKLPVFRTPDDGPAPARRGFAQACGAPVMLIYADDIWGVYILGIIDISDIIHVSGLHTSGVIPSAARDLILSSAITP